ncbi:CGNR zinc finger domain-containing protein [Streptomyces calidiresistens]|nr:ABATE domain-containing protein [Streptomyces calidiresistens]
MEATTGMAMRTASGAPYRFDAGALCLELLITGGPGPYDRYESLHAPEGVRRWVAECRLDPRPGVAVGPDDPAALRRLRDALWRLASARAGAVDPPIGPPTDGDRAVLNEAAAGPPLVTLLGPGNERIAAPGADVPRLMTEIARDAVDLLGGPRGDRLRECAGERCRLLYLDLSRPGRRRWCAMANCGNRHKVRAHRARGGEG